MKYLLYHSAEDQCYTLLGEINEQSLLEDDAKLVKTIDAPNWITAVKIKNEFIEATGDK